MELVNRLHSLTRVPVDRNEALEQAYSDYYFVLLWRASGIDTPELRQIFNRAERIISREDWQ